MPSFVISRSLSIDSFFSSFWIIIWLLHMSSSFVLDTGYCECLIIGCLDLRGFFSFKELKRFWKIEIFVSGRANWRSSVKGRWIVLLLDFLTWPFHISCYKLQERWRTLSTKDNYMVILHSWFPLETQETCKKPVKHLALARLSFLR